jgi:anti-anti-sigma factor
MSLKVNSAETRPGVFTVSPIGTLDANSYTILETTVDLILKESPDVLIFDMEYLDYINSMGVRVLLKAKKALEKDNGKIIFMHLQRQIKKVFEILNAIPTLQVFSNIQEMDDCKYFQTSRRWMIIWTQCRRKPAKISSFSLIHTQMGPQPIKYSSN